MSTTQRRSREVVCPFCDRELSRPVTMAVTAGDARSGGRCACGALYILDETGKDVGEIMVLGLGIVADELAKTFADLVPGEDYEDVILSYDWRTHRSAGISTGYMDGYGRLYVIKAKKL